MSDKQCTVKGEVKISGIGLHTGEVSNITICPAKEDHGYVFQRIDIEGEPKIPADCDLVVGTERGTTIEKNGARVYTIEHLLAAVYSLEIDNVLIKIDGPEVPILDGSSRLIIDAIEKVGIEEQSKDKNYFVLDENIPWEDLEKGVEFLAIPDENYRLTVMVDYNSPVLGTQHATMYKLEDFKEEISTCRTFCFLRELEYLADNNLIKGGDLDNAIVLVERENVSEEELRALAKKLGKEELQVEFRGIGTLNSSELKFENEPARHKLLDIVGDLALVGRPIKAHILAARPGHAGNVGFAKVLKEQIKKQEKAGRKFDLSKTVKDINDIEGILPHRYPFLLVDRIIHLDENSVHGLKNVTMNEPFFQGHFPGNPVMPGVLQVEMMAQVGGILALHNVDEPEKWMTYFLKIDECKFKKKVIPGDTLVVEMVLTRPIRRGLVEMRGKTYVNGEVVSEALMLAQIVKEKE